MSLWIFCEKPLPWFFFWYFLWLFFSLQSKGPSGGTELQRPCHVACIWNLPEPSRSKKKIQERKHFEEMTKTKSNEDVTSKPVYGFQYFWRDRAASFEPQSKDTEFRPKLLILLSQSKLRQRLGGALRFGSIMKFFFNRPSSTVKQRFCEMIPVRNKVTP